jgi:hypothetical protein
LGKLLSTESVTITVVVEARIPTSFSLWECQTGDYFGIWNNYCMLYFQGRSQGIYRMDEGHGPYKTVDVIPLRSNVIRQKGEPTLS